jgi:RNA polymerase sigma factor (TIGR02999 family)
MAARLMDREDPDHTLQPSALVNEACLRLCGGRGLRDLPDRRHFFGAASRAMFEILVDHARSRGAEKRGRDRRRVPLLDHWLGRFERQDLDVIAVREALERLAALHERQGQVVTLRFLFGMSHAEVAEHLGVSVGTVENDWRIARAWLRRELGAAGP